MHIRLFGKYVKLEGVFKDNIIKEIGEVLGNNNPFNDGYPEKYIELDKNLKMLDSFLLLIKILTHPIIFIIILISIPFCPKELTITTLLLYGYLYINYKQFKSLKQGMECYNNGQYEEALKHFYKSNIIFVRANDWISYSLIILNRQEENLEFLYTHNIANVRIKIFLQYIQLARYQEAIDYLNNVIDEEEFKTHPFAAVLPALCYLNYCKDPQKAIDYIASKQFIFKSSNKPELYLVYQFLAKCYNATGDTEQENKTASILNNFNFDGGSIEIKEKLNKTIENMTNN